MALPAMPGGQKAAFAANQKTAKQSKAASAAKQAKLKPGPYSGALYDPTQTLSGKALAASAKTIAGLQVDAPIADARHQISLNDQKTATQSKTDFSYYMQLAQAAKDAVAQGSQSASQLQGTLQGIGSATQAQLGQLGQQAGGDALARMNSLGLDGGQTAALGAQTASQQATGVLNSQTAQNFGANQSAINQGELSAIGGATGLRGEEAIGRLAAAGKLEDSPLVQKIADLQGQRGQLTATALGQLRTAERQYQISEQGLAATAAGQQLTAAQDTAKNKLTAQGQQLSAQKAAAQLKVQQRGQDITQRGQDLMLKKAQMGDATARAGIAARQAAAAAALSEKTTNDQATQTWREIALNAKTAKNGVVKPLSPASNIHAQGQLSHIVGLIQSAQAQKKAGTWKLNPDIRSALESKFGFPDAFVEAAYELLGYGAIRPKTAEVLRNTYGMRGGTFKGAPIQVKKAPPPAVDPVTKQVLNTIGNLF